MEYNVKCLHYFNGDVQTRIYSRPIRIGTQEERKKKKENDTTKRTEEAEERSIKSSMNRTKNKIYEIARANRWEWFVTLTFSAEEVERLDYDECTSALCKWLNNMRKQNPDMVYLFVPEEHKRGGYHFHGVIRQADGIQFIDSCHRTKEGKTIYNIKSYGLGFSTATRVENSEAVSKYITKYCTKELCGLTKGKKRYWVSRNALRPATEHFLLGLSEKNVLKEELLEDCKSFNNVPIPLGMGVVEYYENNGIALCAEDLV